MCEKFIKLLVIVAVLVAPVRIAFGDNEHPVDIYLPQVVVAGTTQPCLLLVEGTGTAHIYSEPEGTINTYAFVQAGVNQLSLPFSGNASGYVTVYVSVNGSTKVIGTTTIVVPDN